MELASYFKSVVEQDRCPVVICNTEHDVIYMNPAAVSRYAKSGGAGLIGHSIFDCHNAHSQEIIRQVVDWFREDTAHNIAYTYRNEKENKDVYMVALRNDDGTLIGYYEKHEYRNLETMEKFTGRN
ncbi:MAG: PAS domain-containing protein [Roseburia sp.]|nr:PAS domain-containing protein [Roseburia sp.]MCM1241540.1 PAS domain-containing protein [Roseburia sp.]